MRGLRGFGLCESLRLRGELGWGLGKFADGVLGSWFMGGSRRR